MVICMFPSSILCGASLQGREAGAACGPQTWGPGSDLLIGLCTGLLLLEEMVTQTGKGFMSHFPICLCHCDV